MTDSMFGKSGSYRFWDQFSVFRDAVYEKINSGDNRQSDKDVKRMWRLFKILCGRKDDASELITTIATDVLTRTHCRSTGRHAMPDFRSDEARMTSIVLQGVDQMIACLLSKE